jgi:3-oxoadipate enol-lactonase
MKMAEIGGGIRLHHMDTGPRDAPALVFANSLGCDLRMWDGVLEHLPQGLRIIRYDKRGHGLSTCPEGPYFMGDLVQDAARLLDLLSVKECLFVGLSIGGIIAQGLAAERLDLVRAMVISNTAAKIGTKQMWEDRMAMVREGGVEALADATMERWFAKLTHAERPELVEAYRNMMTRTPAEGYLGCAAAISETDLWESTARLGLPTLGIAGSEDGSTPPDLVRETTELVKGARFELIRGAGHLPCVEKPAEYARLITGFLNETGHI